MIRKLQVFGGAFAAVLLLSSLTASAAVAGIFFEVGATPATITAKASQYQEWTIGGHTVVCKKMEATAKQTTFSSSDILLEGVKYAECSEPAFKERSATVTLNCKIELESNSTISETRSAGKTSITGCSGSPSYQINIASGGCLMTVAAETSKTAEFSANTEFGDITYSNVYKSLGATYKGFLCGEGTELHGVLASYATLTAQNTFLKLSNIP